MGLGECSRGGEETRLREQVERLRREQEEEQRRQREGEEGLDQLVRKAMERTGGKPTADDTVAAKDLCRRHNLPADRANAVVRDVKDGWRREREREEDRREFGPRAEEERLYRRAAEGQSGPPGATPPAIIPPPFPREDPPLFAWEAGARAVGSPAASAHVRRGPEDQQRTGRPEEGQRAHRGNLIIILGFASFLFPFPLAPIAWILGNHDLEEMRKGRMDPTGENSTRTGRLCGKIASIGFLALFGCGLFLDIVMLPFVLRETNPFPPVKMGKPSPAEPVK